MTRLEQRRAELRAQHVERVAKRQAERKPIAFAPRIQPAQAAQRLKASGIIALKALGVVTFIVMPLLLVVPIAIAGFVADRRAAEAAKWRPERDSLGRRVFVRV